MKAIVCEENAPPEVIQEIEKPVPKGTEVRVDVHAARPSLPRASLCPERSDRNTGGHLTSQVADGENRETMVDVDAPAATDTLCAMLHMDAGQEGAWQFPRGPDTPVMVGKQVVIPASLVTVLLSGSPNSQAQAGQRQKTEHWKRAAA